ncbi:Fur family transcriptional regulator [Novispirillum sp. DQ9]|uniref:Fur family transcriptional regulator n=1 Tax=Novispirillum sp. DQ9 TaxID=3398612 RepID=UPI003C7DD0B9
MGDAERLKRAGIRLTRQRLAVVRLLREAPTTHMTVDQAHALSLERGLGLPLATLYNVLNDFAKRGLVRRIDMAERTTFCTDPGEHHHFLDAATGLLSAIPGPQPTVVDMPSPPDGMEIEGVDIIVRVRRAAPGNENAS